MKVIKLFVISIGFYFITGCLMEPVEYRPDFTYQLINNKLIYTCADLKEKIIKVEFNDENIFNLLRYDGFSYDATYDCNPEFEFDSKEKRTEFKRNGRIISQLLKSDKFSVLFKDFSRNSDINFASYFNYNFFNIEVKRDYREQSYLIISSHGAYSEAKLKKSFLYINLKNGNKICYIAELKKVFPQMGPEFPFDLWLNNNSLLTTYDSPIWDYYRLNSKYQIDLSANWELSMEYIKKFVKCAEKYRLLNKSKSLQSEHDFITNCMGYEVYIP